MTEKRSFEDKYEILRTQPRTLSADIPASQKGVYFIILPLIFISWLIHCKHGKETSGDLMANVRDWRKQVSKSDWFN